MSIILCFIGKITASPNVSPLKPLCRCSHVFSIREQWAENWATRQWQRKWLCQRQTLHPPLLASLYHLLSTNSIMNTTFRFASVFKKLSNTTTDLEQGGGWALMVHLGCEIRFTMLSLRIYRYFLLQWHWWGASKSVTVADCRSKRWCFCMRRFFGTKNCHCRWWSR